jgi:hypothetical protein
MFSSHGCSVPVCVVQMDRDLSRSRAILISNAVFTDKMIADLPAAAGCAPAMKALLTSEWCGWPAGRVEILENVAAPPGLVRSLVELTKGIQDVLLLYYVGHGLRTSQGQLALTLRETSTDPELVRHTAIAYKDVAEILRGCPATTKLVILDCCHAELGNKELDQLQSVDIDAEPVDGLYCIWASKEWEVAKSPTSGGLTYFTDAFVKVVRAGIPGRSSQLTIGQIFVELRARLLKARRPEPAQSGNNHARLWPFALNAAPPETHRDIEKEYESLLAWKAEAEAKVQALEAEVAKDALVVQSLREQIQASESAEQERQIRVELSEAHTRLGEAATKQAEAQAEYSDAVASVNQALASEEPPVDVPPSQPDSGEPPTSSVPSEPLSADSTEADESDGPSDHPGTPGAEADVQAAADPEEVTDATQAATLPVAAAVTAQAPADPGTAVMEPIVPIVLTAVDPAPLGTSPAATGKVRPGWLSGLVRPVLLAPSGAVLVLGGLIVAVIMIGFPSHPPPGHIPHQSPASSARQQSPSVSASSSTTPGSTSPTARRPTLRPHPTISTLVPTGLTTEPTSDSPPSSSSPARSSRTAPSHSPTSSGSPTSSSSPQQVAIPDVIGMTSEQATSKLESDGFMVVVVHSDKADRIFKYSPSGKAAPGTTITIWC